MFTLRDRRTGDLFDHWSVLGEKRRRLLERSWAGVFRNHLLEALPVGDLCHHLDDRLGRPSKDLHIVVGVLLLQQLHDLTDAHTVEALAFNMAWHYALDVRSEADSYFCEKTLRNYRRLFIEQGFDEVLFRGLTDRLVRAFAVDTSRQRMDSTALRSAMRTMTRLGIIVETISKFVRELERIHPDHYERIGKEIIRRYVDRGAYRKCNRRSRKPLPLTQITLSLPPPQDRHYDRKRDFHQIGRDRERSIDDAVKWRRSQRNAEPEIGGNRYRREPARRAQPLWGVRVRVPLSAPYIV